MAAAKEIVSPIDNSAGKIYFFSYTAFAYIDQQSEKLPALVWKTPYNDSLKNDRQYHVSFKYIYAYSNGDPE